MMDAEAWEKVFLSEANIDSESSKAYATVFANEKLTLDHLAVLDRQTLNKIGVKPLGDALAILALGQKQAAVANAPTSSKAPAPTPPRLLAEMTHPQWRKFKIDWEVFLSIAQIPQKHIHAQLYSCCEDSVQTTLISNYPDYFTLPVEGLLDILETIVTQKSNPTVYRLAFTGLTQGNDESIQSYVTRLKSSAKDCEYCCPKCKHDLSPNYIKDQLIRGLQNNVLQTDILAKADQLQSLEAVVKHAEAFESALRDQQKLTETPEAYASRISEYQRQKKQAFKHNPGRRPDSFRDSRNVATTSSYQGYKGSPHRPLKCSGCGSSQHGVPGKEARAAACPAWGKKCTSCGCMNHTSHVCRQQQQTRDSAEALMAHVVFDHKHQSFTNVVNDHVEEINATITPFSPQNDPRSPQNIPSAIGKVMRIFPDSGATICLAGPQHLDKLGISHKQLIHCNKVVRAVGGFTISCYGWLPVEFRLNHLTSKQALYICDKVDRIYFSRAGCMDIGILPPSFPFPMDDMDMNSPASTESAQATTVQGPHESATSPTDIPCRPSKLPYTPTNENVPKLKEFLIEQFANTAFSDSAPFPTMSGPPAHIHLRADAIPKARHCPIPVPYHLKQAVKDSLDRDVERGIIAPVPVGSPVEWCSVMVITPKKDGSPRRTVDFQYLNSQCLRETHHVGSSFHLAEQVPPHTKKTVLDATDGYHSVALDPQSQPLTTFITEWGRYMYLRMPQGYLASGDAYTRRYDEIISDVSRKVKKVDDTLLWDDSIESAFWHTWDYLALCASNGIVFNKSKFQFCQDSVEFAGLNIHSEGVRPSSSMLDSITNFPAPTNITDARSWFGLINQVAWAYSLGPVMQPFRDLLKPNAVFVWDDSMETAFEKSKAMVVDLVKDGICAFDISRTTCLAPDWSKDGMGFLLLQKYCTCETTQAPVCCPDGWKLVFAGSRFCTPAESRYASIEGEAAAIAWGLEKCRMFVSGCADLLVVTDHEPLLGILGDRALNDITNPRLFKLKQRTLRYRYKIQHNPGKWHRGSDAMSRNPAGPIREVLHEVRASPSTEEVSAVEELEYCVQAFTTSRLSDISKDNKALTLDNLRASAKSDPSYITLVTTVEEGFPASRSLTPPCIRSFWNVRKRLYTENGLVMIDSRVVIPEHHRKDVLQSLHSAHQGVTGMQERANLSVYWPGISQHIQNYRDGCKICTTYAPSQPVEPLILTPHPEWPFQHICMDMFEVSQHTYLACADRYSGWLLLYHFKPGQMNSSKLISVCRSIFSTYGAPDILSSDGGTIFTSKSFQDFLHDWSVEHRLSSAEYAQSNGRAELAVKSAKRIVYGNTSADGSLENDRIARAILQYRNTPLAGMGASPAQLLLHRQLRDFVPTHPTLFKPHKKWIEAANQREALLAKRNIKLAERYNASARSLPDLSPGEVVAIQSRDKRWRCTGRVVEVLPNRQYRVRMDGSGRITLRNRRFIRKILNTVAHPSPIIPSATIPQPSRPPVLAIPPVPVAAPELQQLAHRPDTPPQTPPAPMTPPRPEAAPMVPKLPRALKRLMDHNKPGIREGLRREGEGEM